MHVRLFILLVSVCFCFACTPDSTPPPNIVFILADDMGIAQLGCYGSSYYETPQLDALAESGMRFTQAYSAAAVCSPTRAALMTGKTPAQLQLTDFIPGDRPTDKPLGIPDWQAFLPLEEITLGERFRDAGYATAIFGKWHLSSHKRPPESEAYNPDKQGFDAFMVTYKPQDGKTDPEHDPHNVDSITQRGIRFLEAHRDEPFFLMLSHNSIHDPLMEAEAAVARYREKEGADSPEAHPVLGAMVERLDRSVGEVVAALERLGLRDNTLLVFYADNGGREAYARQTPFRAGKGWLYEGGIRVPLILNWPGRVPAGAVSEAVVSSMDFTPTLLEAAAIDTMAFIEEGRNFWPVVRGEAPAAREALYWHYPHYHRGSGMRPGAAMRWRDWKLIEWYEQSLTGAGGRELYHLGRDPGESEDLATVYPDTLEMLKTRLQQWRAAVGAQLPPQ